MTEEQVKYVREARSRGEGATAIDRTTGLSRRTIYRLLEEVLGTRP